MKVISSKLCLLFSSSAVSLFSLVSCNCNLLTKWAKEGTGGRAERHGARDVERAVSKESKRHREEWEWESEKAETREQRE